MHEQPNALTLCNVTWKNKINVTDSQSKYLVKYSKRVVSEAQKYNLNDRLLKKKLTQARSHHAQEKP